MKPQPQASTQEVLAGLVERVTFHNSENGFCVLRAKARGHRDVVTVVGHAATIAAGEWITASGEWVNDRTHGQQFKARFLRTSPPTSADGIEKYLSSGMIRGVVPFTPRSSCGRSARRSLDIENDLRGTLRNFGLKVGMVGTVKFEARIRELVADHPDLAAIVEPLLIARRVLREQLDVLHRQLLEIVRHDEVCRRLMTTPGVGPVVALTFRATVDVPSRFTQL